MIQGTVELGSAALPSPFVSHRVSSHTEWVRGPGPVMRVRPLVQEAFNDAIYFKDEALRAFKLGILSLEERAQVRAIRTKNP